jgi:hypothetical protein
MARKNPATRTSTAAVSSPVILPRISSTFAAARIVLVRSPTPAPSFAASRSAFASRKRFSASSRTDRITSTRSSSPRSASSWGMQRRAWCSMESSLGPPGASRASMAL